MDGNILEIKETLAGRIQRFQCDLVDRGENWLVVHYRVPRHIVLDGTNIPAGTASYGYFWSTRHYNAYHFVTPRGKTLALYCNIGDRLRLTRDTVYWRDLAVDVLILPDGAGRILDVDELPDNLPSEMRGFILRTAEKVLSERVQLLTEVEERTATYL